MTGAVVTAPSDWSTRHASVVMNTYGPARRVLARGAGCHVWDEDGRRYLDLLGGIAVNALGHAHPAVVEAVTRQLSTLGHVSNLFATRPQVELAERLVGLLGAPGKVFLCGSGAEANEAALKLSRRTGRTRLVAAAGSFHGRTMGALALTASAAYRTPFEPLPGNVDFVPYGDVEALERAVDDDTAAVVLEPLQGEAGVVVPPAGYLSAARRITRRHETLLWLDEVQTGIGRTGDWFAHRREGVRPDVVTLAKGLGGGLPVGACIGLDGAADLLQPGQHGSTFGGNPVSAAAALATLRTIEADGLLQAVVVVGEHLRAGLLALGHPAVRDVRGLGLLTGTVLAGQHAAAVTTGALDAGFIVNACTPEVLRTAPPLVLEEHHVDRWLHALPGLLDAVTAAAATDEERT